MWYEVLPAMTRLFLLGLLAAQDAQERTADGRAILLLAIPGIAEGIAGGMAGGIAGISAGEPVPGNGVSDIVLSGVLPGMMLYVLSAVTGGAIGEGDALAVWAAGFGRGGGEILSWLTAGTVPAGLYGLVLLRRHLNRKPGKEIRIPFLPFLFFADSLMILWT